MDNNFNETTIARQTNGLKLLCVYDDYGVCRFDCDHGIYFHRPKTSAAKSATSIMDSPATESKLLCVYDDYGVCRFDCDHGIYFHRPKTSKTSTDQEMNSFIAKRHQLVAQKLAALRVHSLISKVWAENHSPAKCMYHHFESLAIPMSKQQDLLAKYLITTKKLGEVVCGSVFKGYRLSDMLQVAIKNIKKVDVNDWAIVDNHILYPLEYCLLNTLSGCNGVIQLLDAYDTGDKFTLILELIPDCMNIAEFIWMNGPQSESFTQNFARDLVSAVHQCHQVGICHRDIKDDNILIQEQSKPKLIDFGLSKLLVDSPYSEISGTPGYMAPELLINVSSEDYDGMAADVFALGVVIYDLIFGCIGWKNIGFPIPKPSIECLNLIIGMTTSHPKDRLTLEQVLAHPWMN